MSLLSPVIETGGVADVGADARSCMKDSRDIQVRLASESDKCDWNRFVEAHVSAETYHLYEWRQIFESVFNNKCYYLVARDNARCVTGILPLVQLRSALFGNFLVSVPCFNYCGILAGTEASQMRLLEEATFLAGSIGAKHIEFRHRNLSLNELPLRQDKVSMRLLLPKNSNELWSGFSSKLRAQIRRPVKEGATCTIGGAELIDKFYGVFARNMRDLGTPVYPKKFFAEIFGLFGEAAKIFVVEIGDRPAAAGLTLRFRGVLEIPFASSLREFNRFAPNMLLYWTALDFAVEQGVRTFDFGRSSRESGTYRFKKQWGAIPESLNWHYKLFDGDDIPKINPDNPKYERLRTAWRLLPVWLTRLIGPRIVRNLP